MKCIASRIWQVPNDLELLTRTSAEVEEWLSTFPLVPRVPYTARQIVEEMGTNIIKYGYDDNLPHSISVQVYLDDALVRVVLEDDGHPFDPFAAPHEPLEDIIATRPEGGLGLILVQKICMRWHYERVGDINRVTLDIARNAPDDEEEAPTPDAP